MGNTAHEQERQAYAELAIRYGDKQLGRKFEKGGGAHEMTQDGFAQGTVVQAACSARNAKRLLMVNYPPSTWYDLVHRVFLRCKTKRKTKIKVLQ